MQIGIDFGTCFSIIAFAEGRAPYIPKDFKEGIPSLFMYSRSQGKCLFGTECLRGEALHYPADVIRHIKKKVRENPGNLDHPPLKSGGKEYSIRYILENYLDYLIGYSRAVAEEDGDICEPLDAVTITVPVGISGGRMLATDYRLLLQQTVQKLTKLPASKVHVLEEPAAAAIGYLYVANRRARIDETKKVMVFDLGGGTLDISIVEYNPSTNVYAVKASEGDLDLGGNDWDEALAKDVMRKCNISGFADENERVSFINSMNALKHLLTLDTVATVPFNHMGTTRNVVNYTRKEFEAATKPLLDRAMALAKKTVSNYSPMGINAIDTIVLVGGSCNMPQVMERLQKEFPTKASEVKRFDPSGAIARGAAIHAKMVEVDPMANKTYGFFTHNSEYDKDMIFNMIYKGTSFNGKKTIEVVSYQTFVALKDDQTQVTFTVYESENKKGYGKDADWVDLNHGETKNGMQAVVNVPSQWRGKATQYVLTPTLTLSTDNIVTLTIRDTSGNIVSTPRQV